MNPPKISFRDRLRRTRSGLDRIAQAMRGPRSKFWTTKDGNQVRICNLTDEHLRNTAIMLTRWGGGHPLYDDILDEVHRRGLRVFAPMAVIPRAELPDDLTSDCAGDFFQA